jgi:hypothetical protein
MTEHPSSTKLQLQWFEIDYFNSTELEIDYFNSTKLEREKMSVASRGSGSLFHNSYRATLSTTTLGGLGSIEGCL